MLKVNRSLSPLFSHVIKNCQAKQIEQFVNLMKPQVEQLFRQDPYKIYIMYFYNSLLCKKFNNVDVNINGLDLEAYATLRCRDAKLCDGNRVKVDFDFNIAFMSAETLKPFELTYTSLVLQPVCPEHSLLFNDVVLIISLKLEIKKGRHLLTIQLDESPRVDFVFSTNSQTDVLTKEEVCVDVSRIEDLQQSNFMKKRSSWNPCRIYKTVKTIPEPVSVCKQHDSNIIGFCVPIRIDRYLHRSFE